MKKIKILPLLLLIIIFICACTADGSPQGAGAKRSEPSFESEFVTADSEKDTKEESILKMQVQIGSETFTATLEDNAAVREFVEMMKKSPVEIDMSDYSGFEKVGALGKSLTANDSRITTAPGDIVLYNENQIVLFYGSNTWSYTKIGHIYDSKALKAALGSGDVTVIFTFAE